MLDWQSLLEALIFPISKVIIKAASWVPPHVIWSQWLDHPLIGEWLPNSLGYAGYKLTNARPAVFINENIPNVSKHALTVIYVYAGIHFLCCKSPNKLQEAGKKCKHLMENDRPRGNVIIFANTATSYLQTLLHRKVMLGWIPITVAAFVSYKKKYMELSALWFVFSKNNEIIGMLP